MPWSFFSSPARACRLICLSLPIYWSAHVTYILVQCPHRDPVQQMCSAGRRSHGARAPRRFPRPRARRNETDNAPLPLLDSPHVWLAPYGVSTRPVGSRRNLDPSTVVSQPAQSEIAARSTTRYSFSLWTSGRASPPDHATDASPAPYGRWICPGARAELNAARRDLRRFRSKFGRSAGSRRTCDSRSRGASQPWELLLGPGGAGMCKRERESTLDEDAARNSSKVDDKGGSRSALIDT